MGYRTRQEEPADTHRVVRAHRRRGVAFVLTIIAVIATIVVAMSFVSAHNTSIGISRNVTDHSKARFVAEVGLELAIAYIRLMPFFSRPTASKI